MKQRRMFVSLAREDACPPPLNLKCLKIYLRLEDFDLAPRKFLRCCGSEALSTVAERSS